MPTPLGRRTVLEVIQWFRVQNCTVIGGVPTIERTENRRFAQQFLSDLQRLQHAFPWMVGRIGTTSDSDNFRVKLNTPDRPIANATQKNRITSHGVAGRDRDRGRMGISCGGQFAKMIHGGSEGHLHLHVSEFNEGTNRCTAENAR